MDNTELHYLTYDPNEIWIEMQMAYFEAGGDLLYPGDEKDMLLRAVQAIIMQAFAGIDNALRMDTLRYAQRDYLKIYGEKRNCPYNEASNATATVQITFKATGKTETISAGEALTADGEILYTLVDDVYDVGYAQTISAEVVCSRAGTVGNGLLSGTQMQFILTHEGVESVYCSADATGGMDDEDLEVYRERIREHGLASVTTGPAKQYESAAKAVSTLILDANAIRLEAGNVGIYLLLSSEESAATVIQSVDEALNSQDARPLTDQVTVALATPVAYTLNVKYIAPTSSDVATAIANAVDEYVAWQDQVIGQAFNPDRLMAMLYQAGCLRVAWGDGSTFNGGEVTYTLIEPNQYCKGTITLAVMD